HEEEPPLTPPPPPRTIVSYHTRISARDISAMRQLITRDSPNRQYVTLASAFDFLNRRLFDGRLPPAIITLQRKAGSHGYPPPRPSQGPPRAGRTAADTAPTPAPPPGRSPPTTPPPPPQEMPHPGQAHSGPPGRARYHNRQWADKMEALGLMPTDTGAPGGQR